MWNTRTTNFEILIGRSFSQMSNFRRVKNSHVFVTRVKNPFYFFTCVTNTCEFFTRITDSLECESQTNLSQAWKIRAYLSHLWRIRANCSQMWQIHTKPSLHSKCDTFIKKRICNTFIFTAAYFPKRNIVLWKEKCWGDIRLFLRRLRIGRTRMGVSRLNRNLFCPSVKLEQSGNVRQPFIHFPVNVSLIWSQILSYAAEIHFVPEQGWSIFCRFDGMRTIWIRIPEVAKYEWFHPSP